MNKPTDAELDILHILWEHQPCTVRLIHEIMVKEKKVGYTTTLKQMQRMEDKNMIIRESPTEGKSFLYRAVEKARVTKSRLVHKMVQKVFDNSVSDLMMHAIGKEKISEDELGRIKDLIEKIENKTK